MAERILEVQGLSKRFGGFTALDAVDLHVDAGERVGLIGPNGSGKTTMINCISGALPCNGGRVVFKGQDITRLPAYRRVRLGLTRSFQIPRPFRSMSVLENLCVPLEYARGDGGHGRDVRGDAMAILELVNFQHRVHESSANLTQVDLRKLELARALAAEPALLVADEAMAGLSEFEIDVVLELLMRLNAEGIAIVLIEHIMRTVLRFSERIVVLVAGRKIADGAPHDVMALPEVERAYLGQ